MELVGIEPTNLLTASQTLSQLSYSPVRYYLWWSQRESDPLWPGLPESARLPTTMVPQSKKRDDKNE